MAMGTLDQKCEQMWNNGQQAFNKISNLANLKENQSAKDVDFTKVKDLKKENLSKALSNVFIFLEKHVKDLKQVADYVKKKDNIVEELNESKDALETENNQLHTQNEKWVEYSKIYAKIEEGFEGWKKELKEEFSVEKQVQKCVKDSLKSIVKDVVKATTENQIFEKTFAEAVKQSQDKISSEARKTFKSSLQEAFQENQDKIVEKTISKHDADQYEKEKRSRNVCISNVTESKKGEIPEKIAEDTRFASQLLQIPEGSIEACFRVGPPLGQGSNEDRLTPRPLIVVLESPDAARKQHRYGIGVKVTSNNRDFWINPDLTRAERKANYDARQFRKRRLQNIKSTKDTGSVVKTSEN